MRLHYGDPQIAIGVVFAVLALLLAIAFVVIAVQAGSEVGFERVHDTVTRYGSGGSRSWSWSA